MKSKSLVLSGIAILGMLPLGTANAAQLVTNGDFENYALAGAPPGWNTTIGAGGTGQFYPGGPPGFPQAPLSGSVAYMGTGTQMFQTFTTIKLQPATLYTITFDSNISVGFVNETYPFAYLYAEMAYGVGSGETSSFGGEFISSADLVSGVQNYLAPLTLTAGSYGFAFTTKSIEEGFVPRCWVAWACSACCAAGVPDDMRAVSLILDLKRRSRPGRRLTLEAGAADSAPPMPMKKPMSACEALSIGFSWSGRFGTEAQRRWPEANRHSLPPSPSLAGMCPDSWSTPSSVVRQADCGLFRSPFDLRLMIDDFGLLI